MAAQASGAGLPSAAGQAAAAHLPAIPSDDSDDELGGVSPGVAYNPFAASSSQPGSPTMPDAMTTMFNRMAEMLQASTQAATAATLAAQAAAGSSQSRSGLESRDLFKILPRPEAFRVEKQEEEHAKWIAWYWSLRQYLVAIDRDFDAELGAIEKNLNTPIPALSGDTQARSFQLYALLSSLIKGRSFQLVKQVGGQQGYEALRLLLLQYQPPSRVRSLGILSAITQVKGFSSKEPLLSQILELERGFEQYEVASSEALQDSLKSALLLRSLTGQMRQHICASLPENAAYSTLREAILRYERTQFRWGTQNVFAQDSSLLTQRPNASQDFNSNVDRPSY